MNVRMILCDVSRPQEYNFFLKLREQGVPTITMYYGMYDRYSYRSSKLHIQRLKERLARVLTYKIVSKAFYARERDVPLILLMTDYRVRVQPSGWMLS